MVVFGRSVAESNESESKPDPADVERRKKELLAAARGEKRSGSEGSMAGLGIQFVITVMVFLFLGQWLDRRLGTTPWLLLLGVLLGAALGMWNMVRAARQAEKDERRQAGLGTRKGQLGEE